MGRKCDASSQHGHGIRSPAPPRFSVKTETASALRLTTPYGRAHATCGFEILSGVHSGPLGRGRRSRGGWDRVPRARASGRSSFARPASARGVSAGAFAAGAAGWTCGPGIRRLCFTGCNPCLGFAYFFQIHFCASGWD